MLFQLVIDISFLERTSNVGPASCFDVVKNKSSTLSRFSDSRFGFGAKRRNQTWNLLSDAVPLLGAIYDTKDPHEYLNII